MSLKVIVQGKEYQLDEQTQSIMEYLKEANALQKINSNQPFEITNIDEKTWTEVLKLCKIVGNKFPEVAKVKTSDAVEAIGHKQLAEELKAKSPIETNNLYRAAQNLKIRNLRRCISAVLASKIYIKPTLDEYNNKRTELGIEEKLTAEQSREMKNYTFMN